MFTASREPQCNYEIALPIIPNNPECSPIEHYIIWFARFPHCKQSQTKIFSKCPCCWTRYSTYISINAWTLCHLLVQLPHNRNEPSAVVLSRPISMRKFHLRARLSFVRGLRKLGFEVSHLLNGKTTRKIQCLSKVFGTREQLHAIRRLLLSCYPWRPSKVSPLPRTRWVSSRV